MAYRPRRPPILLRTNTMSSKTLQFRFGELPLELQREIFQQSAFEDIGSASRLVYVSKRVYSWVAPAVYSMVTLGSEDATIFVRTLTSKPANFFATHVKCLCLSVSVKPVDAEKILSICTGVKLLALWVDYLAEFPNSSITHLITPLSLRRLSVEVHHLRILCPEPCENPSDVEHCWYTNLTCLDIVFSGDDSAPTFPCLTQFHSLTRVGLWHPQGFVTEDLVLLVLNSCRHLEILLLVVHECDLPQQPRFEDRRVITMPYPSTVVQDWEASFTAKSNTWSRAQEAFLANAKPQGVSDPKGHNSGAIRT